MGKSLCAQKRRTSHKLLFSSIEARLNIPHISLIKRQHADTHIRQQPENKQKRVHKMKTIIATVIALSVSAPAFAGQVNDAAAFFAADNNSAAERVVHATSKGDVYKTQLAGALANDSALENHVDVVASVATKGSNDLLSFFALGNDSAAERVAY
jgi:uncharacterized protein YggU (UPF0235/DUF167 family)